MGPGYIGPSRTVAPVKEPHDIRGAGQVIFGTSNHHLRRSDRAAVCVVMLTEGSQEINKHTIMATYMTCLTPPLLIALVGAFATEKPISTTNHKGPHQRAEPIDRGGTANSLT